MQPQPGTPFTVGPARGARDLTSATFTRALLNESMLRPCCPALNRAPSPGVSAGQPKPTGGLPAQALRERRGPDHETLPEVGNTQTMEPPSVEPDAAQLETLAVELLDSWPTVLERDFALRLDTDASLASSLIVWGLAANTYHGAHAYLRLQRDGFKLPAVAILRNMYESALTSQMGPTS